MSDNAQTRRSGGSYRERLVCTEDIEIKDLENPWNFFFLFLSSDSIVNSWCRANRLLASIVQAALSKFGLPCAFLGKSDFYSFSLGNICAV